MEEWKIKQVEHINRKKTEIAVARGACTAQQLATLDNLMKALRDFDWDFTETLSAAGSPEDMSIGSFTRLLSAYSSFQMYWKESALPDFYDDVVAWQQAHDMAEDVKNFGELYVDLKNLSCVKEKKVCVSCGKDLVGRQKKLCGKKKCKDKHYGKK